MNYKRFHKTLDSNLGELHYHHYENTTCKNKKKLLLLHGSRLAGLETWEKIIGGLDGWSEILVPDLLGVGYLNPLNISCRDFDLNSLLAYVVDLITLHQWASFDIASYSFGGVLSTFLANKLCNQVKKQLLIESALLIATPDQVSAAAHKMNGIANMMSLDPERGNLEFSKLVSKNKNTRSFSITANTRPIYNPLGFANLLYVLSEILLTQDVWSLLSKQKFVSALITERATDEAKGALTEMERLNSWHIYRVTNADHSMVFFQQERISTILNEWGEHE